MSLRAANLAKLVRLSSVIDQSTNSRQTITNIERKASERASLFSVATRKQATIWNSYFFYPFLLISKPFELQLITSESTPNYLPDNQTRLSVYSFSQRSLLIVTCWYLVTETTVASQRTIPLKLAPTKHFTLTPTEFIPILLMDKPSV